MRYGKPTHRLPEPPFAGGYDAQQRALQQAANSDHGKLPTGERTEFRATLKPKQVNTDQIQYTIKGALNDTYTKNQLILAMNLLGIPSLSEAPESEYNKLYTVFNKTIRNASRASRG